MSKFESPFIFKIRFYQPQGANPSKNAAHLKYIGTRPGVAIDDEQVFKNEDFIQQDDNSKEEYEVSEITTDEKELKNFLNEDHNFLEVDHGEKVKDSYEPGTAVGHVKYAGERPGTHGLFDQSGETVSLSELQSEIGEHKGNVWRAILSLKESDAVKLGYIEKEPWENMLRARVAEAANEMKIKESNIRWVAAYHAEEGHPHVHLVFWEKDPTRDRGMLSKGEREDMKRVFMRGIYAQDRVQMHQEKTANRDLMRDVAKGNLQTYVKLLREIKDTNLDVALEQNAIGNVAIGLAPKMFRADEKIVMRSLKELAEIMPEKGRMSFKLMPEPVKEKSLQVADVILKNAFTKTMKGYMDAVEDQTRLHTVDPNAIDEAKRKAYEDIQKRIANLVIRGAGELNRKSYLTIDITVKDKVLQSFSNATGKPIEGEQTDKVLRDFTKVLLSGGMKEELVKQTIQEWKTRADVTISEEQLSKIVDRTIKSFNENEKWDRSTTLPKKQFEELSKILKVESPYLWKSTIPQDNLLNTAKNLWKSVFNSIEKERIQGKAEADLQQKQIERQLKQRQKQLRERGQER